MSGGIAYVLDETGRFHREALQPAGVDLEPLIESEDMQNVRALIERHVELHRQPARRVDSGELGEMLPQFIKVFPHEYKRVLGVAAQRAVISRRCVASVTKRQRCSMGKITGFH